eukprot:2591166-Lingulodinium_polyedra.AAC.1
MDAEGIGQAELQAAQTEFKEQGIAQHSQQGACPAAARVRTHRKHTCAQASDHVEAQGPMRSESKR